MIEFFSMFLSGHIFSTSFFYKLFSVKLKFVEKTRGDFKMKQY